MCGGSLFATVKPVRLARIRIWLCVWLGGAVLSACTGGPISDFPNKATGDGQGSGSDTADDRGEDAGVGPGEGNGDGDGVIPGLDDPADNPDAGLPDARDAGAPMCRSGSDGRPQGFCYGVYCAITLDELTAGSASSGACSATADLELACDGQIGRVVAKCAEENALSPTLETAIAECVNDDAKLAAASDPCLACYVDETLCVLQNCLAPCISGKPERCESCRAAKCSAAFETCSGLPAP